MDAVSQENRVEVASRILGGWGLSADEIAQVLDDPERVIAVLSICESLQVSFEDKDRANRWPAKPNAAFDGATAVEVILRGDTERVRKYLRYHLYNA